MASCAWKPAGSRVPDVAPGELGNWRLYGWRRAGFRCGRLWNFGARIPKRILNEGTRMKRRVTAFLIVAATVIGGVVAKAETIEGALVVPTRTIRNSMRKAALRQADEGVAQALSGYRPTITGSINAGTQYSDTTVVVPPQPTPGSPASSGPSSTSATALFQGRTAPRGAGLNLSQTLFDGHQTPNRTRAAEMQVAAARERMRVVEQSVLLSVAVAYMGFLRDTATLEVQESNVRVLERTLTESRGRLQAGDVAPTQVWQVEAQFASGQASLQSRLATLMASRANYRRIVGIEPASLSPAARSIDSTPHTQCSGRKEPQAKPHGCRGNVRRRCGAVAGQDCRGRPLSDNDVARNCSEHRTARHFDAQAFHWFRGRRDHGSHLPRRTGIFGHSAEKGCCRPTAFFA